MPSIGSIGQRLDLTIRQGGTFGPHTVTAKNPDASPFDLTGGSFLAQIRRKALDTDVVVALTVVILSAAGGQFQFSLTDEQTAALVAGETPQDPLSKYVWDLEFTDTLGRTIPLLYGDVVVFREVSRV